MNKRKIGRLAGFVGAAGMTATLVGGGVSMTGAYFQDTESGVVTATGGEVDIQVSEDTPIETDFSGLLPGQEQFETYNVTNVGTGAVDYYLIATDPSNIDCADDDHLEVNVGDEGWIRACRFNFSELVADDVAKGETVPIELGVRLNAEAGNDSTDKVASATFTVVATQPEAGVPVRDDVDLDDGPKNDA